MAMHGAYATAYAAIRDTMILLYIDLATSRSADQIFCFVFGFFAEAMRAVDEKQRI